MENSLKPISTRRLPQVGLKEQYLGTNDPSLRMSEAMNLKTKSNFLETRGVECQMLGG
jgi:ribonucleoside-diphosphate reductase beta chain